MIRTAHAASFDAVLHAADTLSLMAFGALHFMAVLTSLQSWWRARRNPSVKRWKRCTFCAIAATAGLTLIVAAILLAPQHSPTAMLAGRLTLVPLHAWHTTRRTWVATRRLIGRPAAKGIMAAASAIARRLDPHL